MAQSQIVAERLRANGFVVELLEIATSGDIVRDRPIWEIGGQGVFVKEVQRAVIEQRADIAVHSAKDLPSSFAAEGLVLACVPERGDPRDALVGCTVAELREGAVIATGSRRRQALLAHLRPDLNFVGLRGNIPSRVAAGESEGVDASVVAVAGAALVGLADRLSDILSVETMVPQIGQGALAIECGEDDDEVRAALAAIEHTDSRRAVDAERAFLRRLGGGCEQPVGAHAIIDGNEISIVGVIASVDGRQLFRGARRGNSADIGTALAEELLDNGAGRLVG